ncbi:MAG: hypothetical protein K0S80_1383 [Neobacillus sp.]|nr:hypothetical protein [Neobacillus sp.]
MYFHPDLVDVDLDEIAQEMSNVEKLKEFLEQYDDAVKEAKEEPFRKKSDLEFELAGWNKREFFSMKKPPRKFKWDFRFIYKYDQDFKHFYKLVVAKRNAKGVGGPSSYLKGKQRLVDGKPFLQE